MPKPWRLTRGGEASLIDIAIWTVETFGPRQAAAYEEDLIAVCRDIAAGTVMSQDCRRLIDPSLPEDLRFARAGQHFVIFIEDPEEVIIIDFLQGRSDLPRRLAKPKKTRRRGNKTPQRDFRIPLMKVLLELGGSAEVQDIRKKMLPVVKDRLTQDDYEPVSTGEERWWNAICWERSDIVKEGLFRDDSPRGVWELSDKGRAFIISQLK